MYLSTRYMPNTGENDVNTIQLYNMLAYYSRFSIVAMAFVVTQSDL